MKLFCRRQNYTSFRMTHPYAWLLLIEAVGVGVGSMGKMNLANFTSYQLNMTKASF
jgi:hypothetical protein